MTSRPHDGKTPVTTLAGPYGHPFHPILVAVPIGACVNRYRPRVADELTPAGGLSSVSAS